MKTGSTDYPAPAGKQKNKIISSLRENEILLLLCLAEFIFMLGVGIATPILPLYAQSFGVTATSVGLVISVFGLARMFINLPAGYVSEHWGRRILLIGGAGITVIASLLCAFAADLNQLIGFRLLAGVGSAMFTTGAMAFIADVSTAANRGRVMGAYQGSLLLGAGLGPAPGGIIGDLFGYRAPFLFVAGLSLICALWVVFRVPETRGAHAHPRHQSATPPTRTSSLQGLKLLLLDMNFVLVSLVTIGLFFTRTGAQQGILPLMGFSRLGMTASQLGVAFTLIAAMNFVCLALSGVLADRYGRKAVIVPGTLFSGISLFLFIASTDIWMFMLASIIMGLATGLCGPAPAAYVADLSPQGMHGITMGLYRTYSDIGFVVGPTFLGWLADQTDYEFALTTNAGLVVVSAILFAFFARETLQRKTISRIESSEA